MKVTIIPSDGRLAVDGRFLPVDLSDLPPGIHAVQWDSTAGHVEFTDGRPNSAIATLEDFQPWLDRWTAARRAVDNPPPPTQDEVISGYVSAMQRRLDAGAQSWGYDDIKSAVGYVGDPHPQFDAEGRALRDWRSDCWVWGIAQRDGILAGRTPVPASEAAFISGMPAMPTRPRAA